MTRGGFFLLYGSATGQARSIAEELSEEAKRRGLRPLLMSMNEATERIASAHCLVLITSTTGDGDTPENAEKFVRRLHHNDLPANWLDKLQYALLGLGDTNYSNFCNCAKRVDARLAELGARRFVDSGFADDATSLEQTVEPWLDGLWPALLACAGQDVLQENSDDQPLDVEASANDDDSDSEVVASTEEEALPTDTMALALMQLARLSVAAGSAGAAPEPAQLLGDEHAELRLLSDADITVPGLPSFVLQTKRVEDEVAAAASSEHLTAGQNPGCALPCAAGELCVAPLLSRRRLTADGAVKAVFQVQLDVCHAAWSAQWTPGDSFGLVTPNPAGEVDALLARLGLHRAAAQQPLHLVSVGKRLASHLPSGVTCWRSLLMRCADIRATPGAPLLRLLAAHTSEKSAPRQHRRLLELCSREALRVRPALLNRPGLSLLDVLLHFPAARPPPHRLLQLLPRLQPRPYSAASSPLAVGASDRLTLVFTEVQLAATEGRRYARQGLATGLLQELEPGRDTVALFLRKNPSLFGLPVPPTPLLLVCAGAGVAPFRGFLEHLEQQQHEQPSDVWLVFGCRQREKDQLFAEEMLRWQETGLLSRYLVATSQEEPTNYVQDLLRAESAQVAQFLLTPDVKVMVCGDAAGLAKGVASALEYVLSEGAKLGAEKANQLLTEMRMQRRYQEDVWT